MAKISLILFVTVLTVPSVLMSKVSNQTQRLHSTVNNDPTFTATDCPGFGDNSQRNSFLQYFIGNKMPSGLFNSDDPNVLYLCQTHPTQTPIRSYYSTIFHTTTVNAILSAYSVTQEEAIRIGENPERTNDWKSNHGKSGKLFNRNQYETLYRRGDNAKNYQKGHLLPFSIYSFDGRYGESTFDYSNAVPQRAVWNMGVWKSFEKAIKRYTQLTCGCRYRGKMYLLTGTSQFYKDPSIIQPAMEITYNTHKRRSDRTVIKWSITIPKVMWTAGCCIGSDPESGKQKVESIAVIGNNLPQNTRTEATEVSKLQLWLANGHGPVKLFPGQPACSIPGNSYILKV